MVWTATFHGMTARPCRGFFRLFSAKVGELLTKSPLGSPGSLCPEDFAQSIPYQVERLSRKRICDSAAIRFSCNSRFSTSVRSGATGWWGWPTQ